MRWRQTPTTAPSSASSVTTTTVSPAFAGKRKRTFRSATTTCQPISDSTWSPSPTDSSASVRPASNHDT